MTLDPHFTAYKNIHKMDPESKFRAKNLKLLEENRQILVTLDLVTES
jgi:hypothetical protein